MKTHWKIYSLLVALYLPILTIGQISRSENESGYWTLGFNGGFSYQTSDIRSTDQGFGFGATLGRNLYYKASSPLSFDLRGRLLFARQYGLDPYRSYAIEENEKLNGTFELDYTLYPGQLNIDRGFVYQNYRTDVFELGLEGVFTFNHLRERTGLIFSFYGGVGLDWYLAKMDQADASGKEYYNAYAGLDESTSKNTIRNQLRDAILDGSYETPAHHFEDFGKVDFMPSLGFELGYEVSPKFSIFAGHRFTFSGTDLLDGHQWKSPDKDIYHYTNFGLRWKIYPQRKQHIVKAPEIDITRPYTDPYRTRDPKDGFVRADIRNINSHSDVECRLNGRVIPFNYSYGTFETEFLLEQGRNEIQIIARNTMGSTSKSVVILLEEVVVPPVTGNAAPSIVITNPPYPEYPVNESNFLVQAVIENIRSRDAITFYLNEQSYRYDYNITNGNFSADISLQEGINEIRIIAGNTFGEREAASSIFREVVIPPPAVEILQPAADYVETNENNVRILANIYEVTRKDQIRLLINGQPTINFSFSPTTGQIDADILLQRGNNTIEIVVNTEGGSASDQVSIVFREAQTHRPRPIIHFEIPEQRQVSTFQSSGNIQADIQYANGKNDIVFEINGQRTYNFDFSGNQLRASVPLREGENEVRVTAYNEAGNASEAVYILREREAIPITPPDVSISYPRDGEQLTRSDIDFRAVTRYVLNKGDIALYINNRRSYGFSYNSFNGQVSANLPLQPGRNDIVIQVTNTDGQATDQVAVIYRQPLPPIVRIISPRDGFRTRESHVAIQAITQQISRINQLNFLVNELKINQFDFSGARGEFGANITLRPGQNTIRIMAENIDGRAEDQVTVFYEQIPAPVITINRPIDNSTSDQQLVRLEATLRHISNRSEITVTVNGQNVPNFTYAGSTNSLIADISLREGANAITVQAVNASGRTEAGVKVNYSPLRAPSVTITDPAGAIAQSTTDNYTIRAKTIQVAQRSDITLIINGQNNTSFSWNAESGLLSLPLKLNEGDNTIRIQVRNAAGQAEAGTIIQYQAPKPPEVTIEQPQNQQKTPVGRITLRAKVTHVTGKRFIIIKVNDLYRTDFILEGEVVTLEIVDLKEGINQISISASNPFGRDAEERTVIFEPVRISPPTVEILSVSNPVVDFNNPGFGLAKLIAKIENLDKAEQITLTVNEKTITDFSFQTEKRNIEANLVLERGKTNVILIEVKNEAGMAKARREVRF